MYVLYVCPECYTQISVYEDVVYVCVRYAHTHVCITCVHAHRSRLDGSISLPCIYGPRTQIGVNVSHTCMHHEYMSKVQFHVYMCGHISQ